jgi:arginyl-tRNA synthetase
LRESRLRLADTTALVINRALGLLGIESPEVM